MHRTWLALLFLGLSASLIAQNGRASPSASAPFPVRAVNEKGQVIGQAYAIPVDGGYLTPRGLLAGAFRVEIQMREGKQLVTEVYGEDVERNLLLVGTGIEPTSVFASEPLPVEESAAWVIRCGAEIEIPVKEFLARDLPAFGLIYLGRTAHGDSINGCPVWNDSGKWSGVVVWESPMARPSVAIVPSSVAVALPVGTKLSWEEWRNAQSAEGLRFRNSLLLDGLQDIWRAQYASAIESLSLAVQRSPSDGRSWYYLGYAKAMSGDRPGAMEDYERAVLEDPKNIDAHFSLGFSYLLLRRKLEAMEQAKELDKLDEVMAMRLRMLIEAMSEPSPHETEVGPPAEDLASPAKPPLPTEVKPPAEKVRPDPR